MRFKVVGRRWWRPPVPRPGRPGKRAENQAEERGEFGKFHPAPPLPRVHSPPSPSRRVLFLALKVGLKCINIKKALLTYIWRKPISSV